MTSILTAAEKQAMKKSIAKTPYHELVARQQYIVGRLDEIGIEDINPYASARSKAKKKKDSKQKQQQQQQQHVEETKKDETLTNDAEATKSEASTVADTAVAADTSTATATATTIATATATATAIATAVVPYTPKTDVHWDFVMKEMLWLSVDFGGERKRQISLARKQAASMSKHHTTKEKRRLRALADMESKKRRLASKMARDVVKGWWHGKIERVIAYKQKVDADLVRKRGMDRHLVNLVRQTEKYTNLLNKQLINGDDNNDGDENDDENEGGRSTPKLSIEEALQSEIDDRNGQISLLEETRTSRSRHRSSYRYRDYQSLANQLKSNQETEFYGESTEDDEGGSESMASYDDDDACLSSDDETTLIEAEALDQSFPEQIAREANLLLEESQMNVEDVLKRLEEERDLEHECEHEHEHESVCDKKALPLPSKRSKRVKFAEKISDERTIPTRTSTKVGDTNDMDIWNDGNDADDDADMSDVDDFSDQKDRHKSFKMSSNDDSGDGDDDGDDGDGNKDGDGDSSGSEEFESNPSEGIDDESTMEAEMRMKPEIDPQDEIAMLQKEAEMSVEELRAMIYGGSGDSGGTDDGEDTDNVDQIHEAPEGDTDDHSNNDGDDGDGDSNGSEEFESNPSEGIDDESTLETEMRMKPEIDPQDEIAILQREAEMSVEELRAMIYGGENASDDTGICSAPSGEKDEDNGDGGNSSGSEEFESNPSEGIDDESTLEAEMKMKPEIDPQEELDLLKRESEMSVEELRAKYANMEQDLAASQDEDSIDEIEEESCEKSDIEEDPFSFDDSAEKDEFHPTSSITADVDDETTIEAEERLGRDMSYDDEINLLKRENEMSVEELRAMYCPRDEGCKENSESSNSSQDQKRKFDEQSNDESDMDNSRDLKKAKTSSDEDEGAAALRSLEYADEKARNTAVSRPFLISSWVKLREYQQIGLNWLVSIQTRRLNGILADEMGLGKTLQTIALLSYLASYKGIWGPHLIIVPTSCIVNWETEIKRFCPAFKVLCYYGSAKRRKELRQGWTKTNWNHIVITSYQLVVQDSFAFRRKKWYYMVLDEAHNIKNFQSQRWQTLIHFNTQRRLLLTGTPLQNNLMELWSLLHFLMPHVFRSRKEFSYWFSNPMNNIIEGNASRNDDLIGRLHGIIRPFILRRLKKDVETQMPGKYEHIVKCTLSRRQMFLYEEFMARSTTRVALEKGGNYMGMMNVLMQLRKVCNHPDLFEPRSIVTPLSTERISMVTAACVVHALSDDKPLRCLSKYLVHPIWSLGGGIPCFDESLKQDDQVTKRRHELQTDSNVLKQKFDTSLLDEPLPPEGTNRGISLLLKSIWSEARSEYQRVGASQSRINKSRCDDRSFLLPTKLQNMVNIDLTSSQLSQTSDFTYAQVASTPLELLQMRASQEKSLKRESNDLKKHFVFYVPKAGSHSPLLFPKHPQPNNSDLIKVIEESSIARTNGLFFPDKKLVQFDAGKLQTLAELLRSLKQGKHRVLIFTQMSKMLDILEVFLNLNGHTYVRLDGGTGIDQRQRLMDRFNNDTKIFCFILSTRSGGLGINLTGADTVVFYDSDWNPAMDAQAQDRAHRIGQTRDVHIYRLVTEHTIEENILIKAKQKRHLDFLVMDEGKFHAESNAASDMDIDEAKGDGHDSEFDLTTKGGLRNILGVASKSNGDSAEQNDKNDNTVANENELSKDQLESTLATLEDEDDVLAMRGAQAEAKAELQEFDENHQASKEEDGNESQGSQEEDKSNDKKQPPLEGVKKSEEENQAAILEKEFAVWQAQVGVDKASIDSSLNPVERYALNFKEDVDPFYSMWYLSEEDRLEETESLPQEEFDIEAIELMKEELEANAINDGDLLATLPEPKDLLRQRHLYFREKSRLLANKKRRKLTGENWTTKIDGKSKLPFWYNSDTGEAIWEKPKVINELEEYERANQKQWNAVPLKSLFNMMEHLLPFPERMKCASVCKHWRKAAQDISFVRHVFPVEMGALSMDRAKMDHYHYRTIAEALQNCLPGDTIELGDGHYWVNESELSINFPLRIIGDEKDPSHVVIELSGTVAWNGDKGFVEGVTFRRPRMNLDEKKANELIRIGVGGRVEFAKCAVEGTREKVATASLSEFKECGFLVKGKLILNDSAISNVQGNGVECMNNSSVSLLGSRIVGNSGLAVQAEGNVSLFRDDDEKIAIMNMME